MGSNTRLISMAADSHVAVLIQIIAIGALAWSILGLVEHVAASVMMGTFLGVLTASSWGPLAGSRIRTAADQFAAQTQNPPTGLLDRSNGMRRLETELAHAEFHDRPLSLGLIRFRPHGTDQPAEAGEPADEQILRARQALSHAIALRLRRDSTSFSCSEDAIAIILPGANHTTASSIGAAILRAAHDTTFTSHDGTPTRLADVGRLEFEVIQRRAPYSSAPAMVKTLLSRVS